MAAIIGTAWNFSSLRGDLWYDSPLLLLGYGGLAVQRPGGMTGLRHVALFVQQFEACLHFYQHLLGMQLEWQPDADNVYLTSGSDNLALHRTPIEGLTLGHQRLDHVGFILSSPAVVDEWYGFLKAQGVVMKTAPRTHRDGAHSFYCLDPDGTVVQMIYHPPIVSSL